MGINPEILLGVKPINIKQPDEIGDIGKILTLKHLLQQGELGGVQLDNARRDQAENERFRALFAGGAKPTPEQVMGAAPKLGQPYIKSLNDQQLHTATMNKTNAQTEEIKAQGVASVFGQAKDQESYDIGRRVALERGWMTPQQIAQLPEQFDPKFTQYLAMGSMKAADRIAAERNAETQRHNQTVEGATGRNAIIGPNGQPNEPVIAARERIARAGDPTRIAIANAGLRARTNETNSFLGPQDQVQAPQVGGGLPAAMPGGAGTSWNGTPLRRESDMRAAVGAVPQGPAVQPGQDAAEALFRNQPGMRQDGAPPGTTGAYLPPEGLAFKPAETANTAPINSPASATGARENLSPRARAAAGSNRVTTTTIADPANPNQTLVINPNITNEERIRAGDRTGVIGSGPKLTQTGTADQKLALNKPQAELRIKEMERNFDRLDAAVFELANDKGLTNITGTVMGRTPNVTNSATSAQAKLDTIKSNVFQSSLQAMREASKSGGALGSVSDKEGAKLEATLAALGQAQSTDSFKKELTKVREQVKQAKANIREAYENQYAGVQGRGDSGGAPQSNAAPVRIRGDDGYNALPAGALYIGPDGVTRRK